MYRKNRMMYRKTTSHESIRKVDLEYRNSRFFYFILFFCLGKSRRGKTSNSQNKRVHNRGF